MATAIATHLELIEGTSDKFYRVTDLPGRGWLVLTRWGRRGTHGQAKIVRGWSSDLIEAKKARGYQVVLSSISLDVETGPWSVGVPARGRVEDVDASFETSAARRWTDRLDTSVDGEQVVVAVRDLPRWEHTPGFGALAGVLEGMASHTAGHWTLVAMPAELAAGMQRWPHPWSSAGLVVGPAPAGLDAAGIEVAAGLCANAGLLGVAELSEALEMAAMVSVHRS